MGKEKVYILEIIVDDTYEGYTMTYEKCYKSQEDAETQKEYLFKHEEAALDEADIDYGYSIRNVVVKELEVV